MAFRLYDTFGFPLDLTEDALRAQGLGVDVAGFEDAMERQRAAARAAWVGSGEAATETLWYELRVRIGASEFLGYETEVAEGRIEAMVHEGVEVDTVAEGAEAIFVVNQTPFYGEAGGPDRRCRGLFFRRGHGDRGARHDQAARRSLSPPRHRDPRHGANRRCGRAANR